MGGGVDEGACEGGSEEVSECVALLKHAGDDTPGGIGTVFEGCGGGVAVQTTHRDTEEGANGEKLRIGLAEAGTELKDDEENVVDYKGPVKM